MVSGCERRELTLGRECCFSVVGELPVVGGAVRGALAASWRQRDLRGCYHP